MKRWDRDGTASDLEEGVMMSYGEPKRLLLSQHRHLRPLLIALDKEASEVLSSESGTGGQEVQILRERIESLHRELVDHFEAEEALFERELSETDQWGPFRLARLRSAHSRHRALLAALRADPPLLPPHSLAHVASALTSEVLGQMVEEECELAAGGTLQEDSALAI
jgi:hypothetical protein